MTATSPSAVSVMGIEAALTNSCCGHSRTRTAKRNRSASKCLVRTHSSRTDERHRPARLFNSILSQTSNVLFPCPAFQSCTHITPPRGTYHFHHQVSDSVLLISWAGHAKRTAHDVTIYHPTHHKVLLASHALLASKENTMPQSIAPFQGRMRNCRIESVSM